MNASARAWLALSDRLELRAQQEVTLPMVRRCVNASLYAYRRYCRARDAQERRFMTLFEARP